MEVTLSPEEQKYARFLAKKRYEYAREQGKVNVRKGPQSDEVTDLEGIAGEMAYCKIFNVYPDFQTNVIPKADCILHNGLTVDIKTTKYAKGHLIAAKWKGDGVDLYALMVGTFPTYKFVGLATKQELLAKENITNFGRGDLYALPQEKLTYPF